MLYLANISHEKTEEERMVRCTSYSFHQINEVSLLESYYKRTHKLRLECQVEVRM